jgi:RNA polymerase sigma-70 factor (ECF subfamily)
MSRELTLNDGACSFWLVSKARVRRLDVFRKPGVGDQTDERLLERWRNGDQQAATELFYRYAERLTVLARSRLSARLAQRVDPEDVVHSAYRSFFANVGRDRYDLKRGGDLWRLLVAITLHKLNDQVKRHTNRKRGIDKECTFGSEDSLLGMHAHLLARDASPVEAAALTEVVQEVMRQLQPTERRMLELRLQGYNLDEIAAATQYSERTVRYSLRRVKQLLEQLTPS